MAGKLERGLSLGGAIGVIVGIIVGASIFVLIPSLAGMAGPSLSLAYAVSVIPAIFYVLYLIQLGGALPVTGGHYIAVTRWISPLAGVMASLGTVVAIIGTISLTAWGFASYLRGFLPSVPPMAIAMGVVILFGVINYLGIKLSGRIQAIMVGLFIIAMLIFGIGGLANFHPQLLTPFFPNGAGPFFMVIVIATFSWAGFVAIVEVAGEVQNPKRNIPRALVISLVIILVLYILQTFALTSVLKWDQVAKIGPTAVLVAASKFLPSGVVDFIVLAALLAMATTVNATLLTATRDITAWGRDGVVPEVMSRINPQFKTPGSAIVFTTLASLVGVLFAVSLDQYALVVVLALMVLKVLAATATWRMPKKAPEIYEKSTFKFSSFWRTFIWLGVVIISALIFVFGVISDLSTGLVFIGLLAFGVIYWYLRKGYLMKQGIDLEKKLRDMSDVVLEELAER